MKITVGMPVVDHVPGEIIESLLKAFVEIHRIKESQINITVPMNVFPHDRARSFIHQQADQGDSDYLIYFDSDMVIPPDAGPKMLSVLLETGAVLDTGFYYRRGWDYSPVWHRKHESGNGYNRIIADVDDPLVELDSCGLGCAMVDLKWVRANLKPPYYTMGMEEMSSNITDDVSFCEKIKAANGKIIGIPSLRCGHMGNRQVICDVTVRSLVEIESQLRTP